MRSSNFPEIQYLINLYEKYDIGVSLQQNDFLGDNKDYPALLFSVGRKSYKIYVDNEYDDVKLKNHLLNLYLVLRALEDFKLEPDFNHWCVAQGIPSSHCEIATYYEDLGNSFKSLEELFGEIDSGISSLDFQLNAGAIQELRNFVN